MDQIIEFLISQWIYDMSIFLNIWLYILLLIPFTVYLVFFICKWTVFAIPIWVPLLIIIKHFRR